MGTDFFWEVEIKGGEGSGHHGHQGRPGQQGGSLPGGGRLADPNPMPNPNPDPNPVPRSFANTVLNEHWVKQKALGGVGAGGSWVVEYANGKKGVYKRWGSHHGHSGKMELIADDLDDALRLGLVPKTVKVDNDDVDKGTVQEFIEGATVGQLYGFESHEKAISENKERVAKMAVLDFLMMNHDRNLGNYLFDENGKMWAVDHGHARASSIAGQRGTLFEPVMARAYDPIIKDGRISIPPDLLENLQNRRFRNSMRRSLEYNAGELITNGIVIRMTHLAELGYVPANHYSEFYEYGG